MTNPIKQPRFKLGISARREARDAILSSDGWDDYRKARKINSAMLSGDILFDAADALGVSVKAVVNGNVLEARAAGAALLEGDKAAVQASAAQAASVDWQRVRTIARDEAKEAIERQVQPVVIERQIIITPQRTIQTGDDIKHPAFDTLLAWVNARDFSGNRLNVYLFGPTGTGKTYAAAQVAKLMGLDFYSHSTAQEAYDLIGYKEVSGDLMEPDFIRAFEKGGVCLLDEVDRYDVKAVTVVNSALANGWLVKPDGTRVKRHDDFICIGAGNTNGLGATTDFTAAEKLDLSTLSRFAAKIAWGVSPELELRAAEERSNNPEVAVMWLKEVRAVRKALDRLGLPASADQRCVEAGANMIAAGMDIDTVRDCTYLAGLADDQREGVLNLSAGARITERQLSIVVKGTN